MSADRFCGLLCTFKGAKFVQEWLVGTHLEPPVAVPDIQGIVCLDVHSLVPVFVSRVLIA